MNPFKPSEEADLFQHCLELPSHEREGILDSCCANNPGLKNRVLGLLRSCDLSEDFMETPPALAEINGETLDGRPGDKIDRYRLRELIGEGAWGSVWLAEQTGDLKRRVALKILKPGMDTHDFLARFEAERQILAMMDHPGIAHVYDAGTTDHGHPYFVMEFIPGKNLMEYADYHRLNLEERVRLFIQVCQALQHAHQKGIIHRDLKPSNILVAEQDDHPQPKVIDFGIAKSTQQRVTDKTVYTQIHTFLGTPVYSSPEQLEPSGRQFDHRSDIYSLGALLYELLCGRKVFSEQLTSGDLEDIRSTIRDNDPSRPSIRFAALSEKEKETLAECRNNTPSMVSFHLKGDLDWIVLKCLEKDRSRRYESAQALADDLGNYLTNRPVTAAAPSTSYRIRKYVIRQREKVSAWALVPAAIFAVLAVFFYFRTSPPVAPQQEAGALVTSIDLPEKSIAVLPFENRSNLKEDKHFTDGIHEELLNQIAKIKDITTIARTSVMSYRDTIRRIPVIAEELNVRYLLEGGVLRGGDQIRINVQLVDAISEEHVWTESYLRELSLENIVGIQSEIARSIARALKAVLSPQEERQFNKLPTYNMEAMEAYFLGKNRPTTRPGMIDAIQDYERAISLDPNFALAYVALARKELNLLQRAGLSRDEQYGKAERLLSKAQELDDSLAEVYLGLADLRQRQRYTEGVLDACRKALEIQPNNAEAFTFLGRISERTLGNAEEAGRLYRKAYDLNPKAKELLALSLSCFGEIEAALKQREQIAIEKPASSQSFLNLGRSCRWDFGRYDEGIVVHRKQISLDPTATHVQDMLAECYQYLGDVESAVRWKRRYIASNPLNSLNTKSGLAELLGNVALRRQAAEEQYAIDPTYGHPPLEHVIDLDLASGNLAKARARVERDFPELLEASIEIWASNLSQAIQVARVLMRTGEESQAKILLRKALVRLDSMQQRHIEKRKEAVIYALLGDDEMTLGTLDQFFDLGGSPYDLELEDELKSYFDHPEYRAMAENRKAELAVQLERVRRMEANEELAPIPENVLQLVMNGLPDASKASGKSVAVLPFENLSSGETGQAFTNGIPGELISLLAGVQGIRSMTRNSTLVYRDPLQPRRLIGEELGVNYLVAGTVQTAKESIRISVQLVDAASEENLWGDVFSAELSAQNVFEIQGDICRAIIAALKAELSPGDEKEFDRIPTWNLKAVEAYFEGREIVDRRSNSARQEAIGLLKKAVALDPNFDRSHLWLGKAYLHTFSAMTREDILRDQGLAEKEIRRAIELNPHLAAAHAALGDIFQEREDLEQAREAYERALAINPYEPDAHKGIYQLDFDSRKFWDMAIRHAALPRSEQLVALDPNRSEFRIWLAYSFMQLGQFEEAQRELKKARELNPKHAFYYYAYAQLPEFCLGRLDEAVSLYREAIELDPLNNGFYPRITEVYHKLGCAEEELRWLKVCATKFEKLRNPSRPGIAFQARIEFLTNSKSGAWIELFEQVTREVPSSLFYRRVLLNYDLRYGREAVALERYRSLFSKLFDKTLPDLRSESRQTAIAAMEVAEILLQLGDKDRAYALLDQALTLFSELPRMGWGWEPFERYFGYGIRDVVRHALRGETVEALAGLREAIDAGFCDRLELESSALDSLREEPEFIAIIEGVEADWARQLANVRRMEVNGELVAIPQNILKLMDE